MQSFSGRAAYFTLIGVTLCFFLGFLLLIGLEIAAKRIKRQA
jgi:hypothetical protein